MGSRPRSDEAAKTRCSAFGKCGACQLLNVSYEKQLADKEARIQELFANVAPRQAFRPIMGMDEPFHYRNKVIAPYAPGMKASRGGKRPSKRRGGGPAKGKERVLTGMYAPGTHDIIPTDGCLLENEAAKAATLAVRDLMLKWDIPPYDEDTGRGFIRHVVARAGRTGELLVTVVTNGSEFPSSRSFCRELVRRVPEVTTVVQNVNTRMTNVILGEEERTLYGPGFILDEMCGLKFRISSASFYQVNAEQAEALYRAAVSMATAGPDDLIIDAYCGTGTIGLVAAKESGASLLGVEASADAVRDAKMNARHNGVERADLICQDATAFLEEAASGEGFRHDGDVILMMDPPRAGSTPEFLQAAAKLAPKRIVYISCDPRTQARDVKLLCELGYSIEAVQPVDMFPHTDHIENIILLTC